MARILSDVVPNPNKIPIYQLHKIPIYQFNNKYQTSANQFGCYNKYNTNI